MVELQLPKLVTRVRFPSPALSKEQGWFQFMMLKTARVLSHPVNRGA